MKNAFIINAHHYYDYSQGGLSKALVERISGQLMEKGYTIHHTSTDNNWQIEDELEKHQRADIIIVQSPVNWMGVPWPMKKYMDEVYTAGMFGALCQNDGRTKEAPKEGYGTGGVLQGKRYMLSLTFNAPREAFDDPAQYLFQGKSVDDLWFPVHMNFRFFGMKALPTFACYDVMKNPNIANDFKRLTAHIDANF